MSLLKRLRRLLAQPPVKELVIMAGFWGGLAGVMVGMFMDDKLIGHVSAGVFMVAFASMMAELQR